MYIFFARVRVPTSFRRFRAVQHNNVFVIRDYHISKKKKKNKNVPRNAKCIRLAKWSRQLKWL